MSHVEDNERHHSVRASQSTLTPIESRSGFVGLGKMGTVTAANLAAAGRGVLG
jgi:hypothetical protein